jgi:YHS domain-containing protein
MVRVNFISAVTMFSRKNDNKGICKMLNTYSCDFCGKQFTRHDCFTKGKRHLFCSRKCVADFSSKTKNPEGYASLKDYTNMAINFSNLAKRLNPTRMTFEVREKLHQAHSGKQIIASYRKYYGRHEHRVVMEQMLGRKLRTGEIVHHIDGNRTNNDPSNLMLFMSQAKHAEYHAFINHCKKHPLGGDAE